MATDEVTPPEAVGTRRRRPRWGRWVLAVAGMVLLVVVVVGVWLTADALKAADALLAAHDDVAELQDAVRADDDARADAALAALQANSAAARSATTGPAWAVAGVVPGLGRNTRAVQDVARGVDTLARDALPQLMAAVRLVDPATLAPVDGRVQLAPLQEAAPALRSADAAVRGVVDDLDGIDTARLVDAVASPVEELRGQLRDVASTTATAARAATLLPPMLGADGPRTYLLLAQNNAEPRATGGIPGTVLLLRAEQGAVAVVEDARGGDLTVDAPVLPLTEAEQAIFGPALGSDMRDVTFTPDFPRAAALARGLWSESKGVDVDGVVATDPVALGLLLKATGPIATPEGAELQADTVAALLLNQVYLQVRDPAAQDALFSSAARTVLSAVVAGQGAPADLVDALAEAARQGRLLVWSAHDDEQALLRPTVLSGALVGKRDDSAVVGVYVNDGTMAKLGYYLDVTVTAEATRCYPDGSQDAHVVVTLAYDAPAAAAALPPYVVGLHGVVPPGDLRTNVLVYAPTGGRIDSAAVTPDGMGIFAQVHNGLAVGGRTFDLSPGQSGRLDLRVHTGPSQRGPVLVRTTPLVRSTQPHPSGSSCS